jgi:hypothetical protein
VALVERRRAGWCCPADCLTVTARAIHDFLAGMCACLPDLTPRTITWDHAREATNWRQFEVDADLER